MPKNPEFPSKLTMETVDGERIIRSVKFRIGDTGNFTGSVPGVLKIIILDRGESVIPHADIAYDVVIIRDTQPFQVDRGALIVKFLGDGKNQSPPPKKGAPDYIPMAGKEGPKNLLPVDVDQVAGKVYVLETAIDYNPEGGLLVPNQERFHHFTLDEETLGVIEKVATAVELWQPCLLEGEPATSKTSSIEYLAMMSNHEVVRLNLNGQTDTSELIGKFVPNDGQLHVKFENLLRHGEILKEESREILSKANKEGRGLTLFESQKIAQVEGLKAPDWHWQDGLDIQAKKEGKWLILDEINLAEPQILERLNSQIEKNPSITISENGGILIRSLDPAEMELYRQGKLTGIEPLHPRFRIFATMNSAESAGRQVMSSAFKDRWTSYKFVRPPTAKAYTAMLNLMVYGEQPEVTIDGVAYKTPPAESLFPKLAAIKNLRPFLAKMAKFQETIEDLARKTTIGKGRKEPYIFTRRGLIEFLAFLEQKVFVERKSRKKLTFADVPEIIGSRAITYYYLDKIADPADRKKVVDQLGVIGISEGKWTHKFA